MSVAEARAIAKDAFKKSVRLETDLFVEIEVLLKQHGLECSLERPKGNPQGTMQIRVWWAK